MRLSQSRKGYHAFVEKGVAIGRRPELISGGLIRSMGSWGALETHQKIKEHLKSDERILGDSEFVEAVLQAQDESLERRYRLKARGFNIEKVIQRTAGISGLDAEQIWTPCKEPLRVQARSLVCYWAVRELGMTTVAVSKELGMCQTAVTKAVARGRLLAERRGFTLQE